MPSGRTTSISGFPEWLPSQRLVELALLDRIRRHAELAGFVPLETRAVEPVDVLVGQGETSKEIYTVGRLHDDATTEAELGLHFDLTVPLARYVQEFRGRLRFPFKRWQIQKVWRGERPQEGRYREFYQADLDVIGDGELPLHFDAEMPRLMHELLASLPLPRTTVLVSNRKILDGFGRALDRDDVTEVVRALDKLDRSGVPGVREALVDHHGLDGAEADRWLALAAIRTDDTSFVAKVRALGARDELLDRGLDELATVVDANAGLPDGALVADLHIARGLDYYSGTVLETVVEGNADLGSVCSGGRYDDLASGDGGALPGVGISIGVTRLLGRLFGRGAVRASRATPTCVLVALVDEASRAASTAVAGALRARGIAAETYHAPVRFGRQIRHADRLGVPFVWFPARDGAPHSVRDLRSGEQVPADPGSWTPPAADLAVRVVAGGPDGATGG